MTNPPKPITALLRLNPHPHQPARWRQLGGPVRVLQTWRPDEVTSLLRQVEEGCKAGLHAAGFVSYEAAPAFNPALTVCPSPNQNSQQDFPLLWFALFEEATEVTLPAGRHAKLDWQPATSRQEYDQAIATIREQIAAGVTYQTNYTLRLRAPIDRDLDGLSYFAALAAAQPTEYAAYLDTGRWQVLSVSPELFFRTQGQHICTKPMKGTAARGRFEAEDLAQAAWLSSSEKNRAENIMIVDLLRNDLGKVAEFGSVEVRELCAVERYPSLHTMTSTVCAQLRPQQGLADIFAALFPCGSVTGAPKISTMHLIAGLETQPRQVYCGAVGCVAPGGDSVFNVPIRTVLLDRLRGVAEYGVGGGITWDSDAAGEYAELLTKAQVLGAAPPTFELLETLRLQDGDFVHLDRHLARLASSARYFGWPLSQESLDTELAQARQTAPTGTFRFRLLLRRNGTVTSQTLPLDRTPGPVKAQLAATPVQSSNVFLFHKTTHRAVYAQAAQEVAAGCEALLHNEGGELTEFVTGNLVLELDGQRYTPPVTCGLLAGIAREMALQSGVQERILTPADLAQASAIWHINSLRGWRRVQLAPAKHLA